MDPLRLFLLDQGFPSWIWIRWIINATHKNNFTSPPKLAMSTAMQISAPTSSDFTSGQHFLETLMLLPKTTRTTNSWWLQRLSPLTANTTCYTMANISPWHIQQHTLLSPLHNNFISFPYFFPSYETCSINVNPLFHAAIKNLHIKPYGTFVCLLLHHHPLSYNNT